MDGIDAALLRFTDRHVEIIATLNHPYPEDLRRQLFAVSRNTNAAPNTITVDTLGELNTWTGECFRDASLALLSQAHVDAGDVCAIGSHGQTIRHRPDAEHRFTLQIGDAAIIATGTGIDTVADFRLADLALGGEGAPLAPAFHEWLFHNESQDRVVLNIGGIANITVLPTSGDDVTGFDTGPGNTLLDAWISANENKSFDDGGQWAASGNVCDSLLQRCLADDWFSRPAPKSTGFEYFNLDWLTAAEPGDAKPADVQATLVELTALSIAEAIKAVAPSTREVFVCGGGAHNGYLMTRLAAHLPDSQVASSASAGLDPDWVEAAAFAWLAQQRTADLPGNLPAVTGASRAAILGALYKA